MSLWLTDADQTALASAVRTAWPDQPAPALAPLGEGFGSLALESTDGHVVLVAKNAMGQASRRVSCALLPALAPHVPVAIPEPAWAVESAPGLPFGAFAYGKLPGRPFTAAEATRVQPSLAADIARFLHAIHAFPAARAAELGVPTYAAVRADLASLRAGVMPALAERLTPVEHARVERWWNAFLTDPALDFAAPSLIHGDPWWDNLLVDDEAAHLLGVIDFGDATLGDPAHDFAVLTHHGAPFVRACLEAYAALGGTLGPDAEHRIARWWELRSGSFYSIRASLIAGDEEELADSIGKLRRGAILAG